MPPDTRSVSPRLRHRLLAAGVGLALLLCQSPARAQGILDDLTGSATPSQTQPQAQATTTAEQDPDALRRLLDTARSEAQAAAPPPASATPDEILEQAHLRNDLIGSLEHNLTILERLPEARQRREAQEARGHDWNAFSKPPPYSILMVDRLRDAADAAQNRIEATTTRQALRDQQIDEESRHLKDAEIAVRQAEEKISRTSKPEERERETWLRDLAQLRARTAAAIIAESQADKQLIVIEIAEQRSASALLTRQLDKARVSVQFPQSDLDTVLADLNRQIETLQKRATQMKTTVAQSRRALVEAQQALSAAQADTTLVGDARAQRLNRLERAVDLRRFQADNDELAYEIAVRCIDMRNWEVTGWRYRWLLANSDSHEKFPEALDRTDSLIERLKSWDRYIQGELVRAEHQRDDGALPPTGQPSAEEMALLNDFRAAQRQRVDILRGGQDVIDDMLHELGLWRQDLISQRGARSPKNLARDWWQSARDVLHAVWDFELFAAQDNLEIDGQHVTAVRSVTVGKSLGVILLVLLGSLIGRRLLNGIKHLTVKYLHVSRARAETATKWSHIVVLSMLVIAALYLANIPLTVFAFLGGALAIGAGFGTQVLLKNMVSGLMLLIERPLRVGDIIEVGSVVGTVTNISIRSSTVHTSDGIEILVPNSTFIENNVTNWTYSNPRVRRSVSVGVEYDAPPRKVEALLLAVAGRHPNVLDSPPPQVLLDGFGDDAINFTLRYWIDYGGNTDASRIASDLRFMIAEALTEAGISIPYPQRVVHLAPAPDPAAPARPPQPRMEKATGEA